MRGYVPPLSFGALLAVLGIATVVGVGTAVILHRPFLIVGVIVGAVAIGIVYILLTYWSGPPEPGPATEPDPGRLEEADPRAAADTPAEPVPPTDSAPPSADPTAPSSPPPAAIDPADKEPNYDPVEEA